MKVCRPCKYHTICTIIIRKGHDVTICKALFTGITLELHQSGVTFHLPRIPNSKGQFLELHSSKDKTD